MTTDSFNSHLLDQIIVKLLIRNNTTNETTNVISIKATDPFNSHLQNQIGNKLWIRNYTTFRSQT